jgi:hypothetical protein
VGLGSLWQDTREGLQAAVGSLDDVSTRESSADFCLRVSRRLIFGVPLIAASGFTVRRAGAVEGDFYAFLSGVRRGAASQGVRASTIELALRNTQYLPHVVELDRKQPERTMTFGEYLELTLKPLVVRLPSAEWLESLRVIRCLPVTWQCGALRGQASDKPRGRKPRAGMAQRSGALELWGFESRG